MDIVLFTVNHGRHLEVLLTERSTPPFEGCWSLPGGFVGPQESADDAALRELELKAGVGNVYLEQLYTFTRPDRDPRSRVVSVAYYALVAQERLRRSGGIRNAEWFAAGFHEGRLWVGSPTEPRRLGFDHDEILATAVHRIRGKLEYAPIGYQLLPERFTLTELQQVYEAVLGAPIDKRNFRAKVHRSGQIRPLEEFRTGSHRPARLYTFEGKVF